MGSATSETVAPRDADCELVDRYLQHFALQERAWARLSAGALTEWRRDCITAEVHVDADGRIDRSFGA